LTSLDVGHNDLSEMGIMAIVAGLLARSEPSPLRILRGLEMTVDIASKCGIPRHVASEIDEEEYSGCSLLRWASERVVKSRAVLPLIEKRLPVQRVCCIVGDFIFWRHYLTTKLEVT